MLGGWNGIEDCRVDEMEFVRIYQILLEFARIDENLPTKGIPSKARALLMRRVTDKIKQPNNIVYFQKETEIMYIYNFEHVILLENKSPCGCAPSRTELRKCLSYVLNTQKQRFCVFTKQNMLFCWKKKPLRERTQSHRVYVFYTNNVYLPYIQIVYLTHKYYVGSI